MPIEAHPLTGIMGSMYVFDLNTSESALAPLPTPSNSESGSPTESERKNRNPSQLDAEIG